MEETLNRIIAIRKAKKVSQKEIAKSLGISQAAYAKFESGKSITVDRLLKVADLLNVPIADLIYIMPTKTHNEVSEELELLSHDIDVYEKKLIDLMERIKEQTLTIESIRNEREHIKEHLVMQMISSYSYEIRFIDRLIANTKSNNDKEAWMINKINIINLFNKNKDYYIKTGFLSQSDFDDHYKEMQKTFGKDIYESMPES